MLNILKCVTGVIFCLCLIRSKNWGSLHDEIIREHFRNIEKKTLSV